MHTPPTPTHMRRYVENRVHMRLAVGSRVCGEARERIWSRPRPVLAVHMPSSVLRSAYKRGRVGRGGCGYVQPQHQNQV